MMKRIYLVSKFRKEKLMLEKVKKDKNIKRVPRKPKIEASKYTCEHCEMKTDVKANMERHIKTTHDEVVYIHRCRLCPFYTVHRNSPKIHIERKHVSQKVSCKVCEKVFKNEHSKNEHIRRKHRK